MDMPGKQLSGTASEERKMTRTQKLMPRLKKKKNSDQASSKPVLKVPNLGVRGCWALMSSSGEGVRRNDVNVSDWKSGKRHTANSFI